jgi:hypothetical protein
VAEEQEYAEESEKKGGYAWKLRRSVINRCKVREEKIKGVRGGEVVPIGSEGNWGDTRDARKQWRRKTKTEFDEIMGDSVAGSQGKDLKKGTR